MNDMNFICPTCKRPTHPTDNEIIEYLAKEIDRYTDVLVERTQELERTSRALDVAKKWLMKIGYLNMSDHGLGSEKMMTDWCKTVALHGLKEVEMTLQQKD